jgi:hypothetical protein
MSTRLMLCGRRSFGKPFDLLCLSPAALAADWVALERSTAVQCGPTMRAAGSSHSCWTTVLSRIRSEVSAARWSSPCSSHWTARASPAGRAPVRPHEFGSHYGSGKLFRFLGKHIVNDHIHLHVEIHAVREG